MSEHPPVLVSACLAGLHCRWDGRSCPHPAVVALVAAGRAVPFCPEQLGGLPTPRPPARLAGGGGREVFEGKARVLTEQGLDVTEAFLRGAREAALLADTLGSRGAVLKRGSPSCHPGGEDLGVAAALLAANGLDLADEESLDALPEKPSAPGASLGLKCWLVMGQEPAFGEGLGTLLEGIARSGSISAAAAAMDMSYRQAWGELRQAEERLGVALTVTRVGGEGGGGTTLTPQGRNLLETFRALEGDLRAAAAVLFARHFGRGWHGCVKL